MTGCRRQLLPSDFEHIVHRELSTTNTYKERAEKEMSSSTSRTSSTIERYHSPIESPPSKSTTLTILNNNNNNLKSMKKNIQQNIINNNFIDITANNKLNYQFNENQQEKIIYDINNSTFFLNKVNSFTPFNKSLYYSNNSF